MQRHIIAGIDPGSTVGIAILDLSGKKMASESFGGGIAEAVAAIEKYGTPSLVACDVTPPPDAVQKIASYFSCRLYCPKHNVREEEKRGIARGAGMKNNHERDAYAAAVLAYRAHGNKLRQIDSLDGLSHEDAERVKHLVLRGYRLKDAFLALQEPSEGEQKEGGEPSKARVGAPQKLSSPIAHGSAEELHLRVSSLARENAHLRMLIERLEGEKRQLAERVHLLENGVRQSLLRDNELRKLRFQLQQSLQKMGGRGRQEKHSKKAQNEGETHQREREGGKSQRKESPKKESRVDSGSLEDGLNKLGKRNIDIEKLVAEYRSGRSK